MDLADFLSILSADDALLRKAFTDILTYKLLTSSQNIPG